MAKIPKNDAFEALRDQLQIEQEPDPLIPIARESAAKYDAGWRPRHMPTQKVAFEDKTSKYILLDSERASGKTCLGVDMLIDHCFNNQNALAAILVRVSSIAKDGGAWDKLNNRALDAWKNGNLNQKTNERYDAGIGLLATQPRMEFESKKQFIWILNRFGTWCKVVCLSIPHAAHVQDLIRGREYSFVLVEEAQMLKTDEYFTEVIQQVGRVPFVRWQQQVVYTANPKGPSHWLYKKFFIEPYNEAEDIWDSDFARYHIPISENIENLPDGYYDTVITACRNNPIRYARDVLGEWIDVPEGEAIFRDTFMPNIHVLGDRAKHEGLTPATGNLIITGWDLGVRHTSLHFMQFHILVGGKMLWVVFDELNYVDKYFPYQVLVPKILDRMDYWDAKEFGGPYTWIHISDNAAFNQVRTDGSLDYQKIEQLSRKRIKLIAAPKGPESRAARVHILMDLFSTEQIQISAMCPKTVSALTLVEAEKKKEYDPYQGFVPKKGPFVHVIDSLTYPMIYYQSKGLVASPTTQQAKRTSVLVCGGH